MFSTNLRNKIKQIRSSIIAIGFSLAPNQVTIVGSGFAASDDGKILSAAHIYNQLKPEQTEKLMGMAMVKQEANGMETYKWLPLTLLKKEDKDDAALFQIENHNETLLKPLELGNSDEVEAGDDAYFIGFPYAAQLINDGFGITLIANRTIISNVKCDGMDPNHPRNWFIIDAISNPGNSGCPLLGLEDNKVIGIMAISFGIKKNAVGNPDIRDATHIAGARPINLAKDLVK
jgi:S1-C subfamily serine protease